MWLAALSVTMGAGLPLVANWLAVNSTTVLPVVFASQRFPFRSNAMPAGPLSEPLVALSIIGRHRTPERSPVNLEDRIGVSCS
jgi:hypothetical protein